MKKILILITILATKIAMSQCSLSFNTHTAYCGYCSGSIDAQTSGTAPFTYNWLSPIPGTITGQGTATISNLCGAIYTLTVTDANSCQTTATVTLPLVYITFNYSVTPASCNNCCDGSATLTAMTPYPPVTYSFGCTAQTSSVVTGLCGNTNCHFDAIDNYGCGTSGNLMVPVAVGLLEKSGDVGISLSPNPFDSFCRIKLSRSIQSANLTVYNVSGQVVRTIIVSEEPEIILERGDLSQGFYFLRLTKNGSVITERKLVISNESGN